MSTSKEESERRIGSTIDGKWRLDALIGFSPSAATYRATHRNGLGAVLKIIHRSHSAYPMVVERFLEEARLANRVDHPGIERIFDDGMTEDGCVFLVMDFVEGETLEFKRIAAGGLLPLRKARGIFDGMLDALAAVHAANVAHRSLKPGNVFLARDGRVILTDFGRARLTQGVAHVREDGEPGATAAAPRLIDGIVGGAPGYMPPEQARGRHSEVDARSDVWSAGAILFTTLSGRWVHDAPTVEERRQLAATRTAPRIATVIDIDPALAAVIDRALRFDRTARWASGDEMLRAFRLAAGRDENAERRQRRSSRPPSMPDDGWTSAPRNAIPKIPPIALPPTDLALAGIPLPPREIVDAVARPPSPPPPPPAEPPAPLPKPRAPSSAFVRVAPVSRPPLPSTSSSSPEGTAAGAPGPNDTARMPSSSGADTPPPLPMPIPLSPFLRNDQVLALVTRPRARGRSVLRTLSVVLVVLLVLAGAGIALFVRFRAPR